ncbi:hypothetical protein GCM10010156_52760 [Planobispora rosea]|uniref:Uncharacterized protein n=1 Tax=Planobispora rosea TaxID=35762 RepID=A0A8J3S3W4_PLARO|nr:hypothetical protein [Planobispora rosea]GGS87687.1 hypothetical protein GCM10010156_52760 [Planobispora rosea]GIH86678.1 hypothetical protein Pro02_50860 [Planobispora rosea]
MAENFTPLVEVDFELNGTWTDITAYVRVADRITITRGRGDEQTEVRPGTLALVLNNDGRFTPGNPAPPYWPNVKKGRPIRVRVLHAGGESTRFHGYVNEWPVTWDGGGAITLSRVTATDIFKRLGTLAPMRSLLEQETLAHGPDAYYTLAEQAGAESAGDTSGHGHPPMGVYTYSGGGTGEVDFGDGAGPGTDGLAAVVFKPQSAHIGRFLATPRNTAASGAVVLACWINTTVKGRVFLALWGGDSIAFVVKSNESDGKLNVAASNGSTATISAGLTSSPNLADGSTHLVAVLLQPGGSVYASVDGGPSTLVATFSPHADFGPWVNLPAYRWIFAGGGPSFLGPTTPGSLFDGTMSHLWYGQRNTMPDWTQVWEAGNPETTPERFARLCRVIGTTGTVSGASGTVINAQAAGGRAPIQALRDVAGVEAGLVYASRSGDSIVFECRTHRYNRPSSLTLTADQLAEGGLAWSDDDQHLVNDVTHRREGGADQRWTDTGSITAYGTYADEVTLPWSSDTDALLSAQWKVANGADPPPRITSVSVVANTLTSYGDVLALDLSDVVTLAGLPAGSPQNEVDVHVEGVVEVIDYRHHTLTFHTSPAAVSRVWRLGVPGESELGVNTKLSL